MLKYLVFRAFGRSRLPLARTLILVSFLILGLNCAIIIFRGVSAHDQALAEGKQEAERLVQIISDHTELTFLAADLTLRRAVEKQYYNALFGNNLHDDMQNHFTAWVNQTPQISAMLMTDETGLITTIYRKQGYKTWLEGRETLENESYFRVHKDASDNDLLFAEPQPNWIDHGNFIIMSRRLSKLDGSFGGIVLAAISSSYLTDFYDSLKVNGRTKMLLMYEDQKLLMGTPDDPRDLEMLKGLLRGNSGSSSNISTAINMRGWDEQMRIVSYHYLPHLHIAIALIMHGDDVFAQWWHDRKQDVLLLSVFMLFVLLLSGFGLVMLKQIRRVEKSERGAVMASQAKSEFLANMSHELRTPLNAIIGFSEMLDSGYFGVMNSKQKERVHDIHMCGTHLLELINDILEFSKGEAGKLELKEDKINVPMLVSEVVRFFAEKARQQKVELIETVQADIPRLVADQRKLKQILLNLLSNAVKFSNEGGRVEISARMEDDGRIVFIVSDRGIGMAPEDIPKALSVFGQVHKTEGYEGTGLGLPLCKVFTELHGGKLKIESLKGVGTRVSITLPAERVLKLEVVSAA